MSDIAGYETTVEAIDFPIDERWLNSTNWSSRLIVSKALNWAYGSSEVSVKSETIGFSLWCRGVRLRHHPTRRDLIDLLRIMDYKLKEPTE